MSKNLESVIQNQPKDICHEQPLLQVDSLHYTIGKCPILRGVNLTIQHGEIVVLAGRNGCGKSMLAQHLRGLIPIKKGRGDIIINGTSMRNHKGVHPDVGLVFQDPDIQIVGSSVKRDLSFGPENLQMDSSEINRRVQQIGEQLELTELFDRRPHTLSGGEKRRVAMAGVMIMEPQLLILDEPFVALDYPMIKEILTIILELQKRGVATLIITHDLEVCLAHADSLALMAKGEILSQAPPREHIDRIAEVGLHPPRIPVEACTWLR